MHETEELYRRLVELSPDGIFISRDARIAFLNPAALRLFGASAPEHVLGRSPLDFFHADRHTEIRERIGLLLAGHAVPTIEQRILRLDGTVADVEVTATLFEDRHGRAIQVILRDVTERKRTEAALHASEERSRTQHAELELIYQNAPVGLCVLDRDFRFLRINEQLAEINGVPAAAHLGRTIREILPQLADTLEPLYRRVIETGEPVIGVEVRGPTPRKHGVERSWLASYVPVQRADGVVVGIGCVVEDITERKRAEEATRDSGQRLRLAIDAAKLGTWTHEIDEGIVRYDERAREHFGCAEVARFEESAARTHPDDRPGIAAAIQRAHAPSSDGRYAQEFRVLDGGKTRWLRVDAQVHFDATHPGRPAVRVVGTSQDITERKHAEAALRESEERLRLAFAGAQEGVWDWDLNTGTVVYSPRWKQMLGYGEDDIESHVSAWERLLHPDDRERAHQVNESVARGERDYEVEFRLRHKGGHYIDVLSRGLAVRREPGGPVVRIVGTHFDLTERKQAEAALRESEERLTLAFAGAQEGVWDWNLETGAVVYSAHWKQMLGYADDEIEPHVSAWERLLHPDDRARAQQVNESVARGERDYEAEFRLRHKHGHYIHVLSRGLAVRHDPGGPVVRIVGTHFDLTERKQAEEALRRAQEELEARVRERTAELARANESLREEMSQRERIERARAELLGRLVFAQEDERRRIAREMHDQFGEQLTALGLRIGVLKEACGNEPDLCRQIEALETIAQQLDRDVDNLVWELRPTALDDLGLQAALANFVRTWSAHFGIAVELHAAGLADHRLASEIETTLYRIAQEALNNIAKHSRAEHVEIILERRSDHVSLVVEDDGVGFDPSDGTNASRGLGLLGMQERAALVGATLQVESAVGTGTTILVRMPARTSAIEHA